MTTTYMLELTTEELTVVYGMLVCLDAHKGPAPRTTDDKKADMALESALSKAHRLMEGK
jgi:hypothetical protein